MCDTEVTIWPAFTKCNFERIMKGLDPMPVVSGNIRPQRTQYNFAKRFQNTGQLAKAFIDVYGTQGSIEHMFPDYDSLRTAIENEMLGISDDLWYELRFQYGNMTRKE